MHAEALEWCRRWADDRSGRGLDIGGRDVNGTPRALWSGVTWTVLDIAPGPGVDVVADAATWAPDRQYDLVLSTEVFEHAADWPAIVATAYRACRPGGLLVLTMAGPGRPVHSGLDGGPVLHRGEHYGNVSAADLRTVLVATGWVGVVVDEQLRPSDVRAVAYR